MVFALLAGFNVRRSINLLVTVTAVDVSFLIFLMFLTISLLWAPDLKVGISYVLTTCVSAFIYYTIAKLIFMRPNVGAIAAQLVYTLIFLIIAFAPLTFIEAEWVKGRLFVNGSDAFSIGVTQAAVAAIGLSLYLLRNSFLRVKHTSLFLYAGFFASLILIGFTGSRGAFLVAVLAVTATLISSFRRHFILMSVFCSAGFAFDLSFNNSGVRFLEFGNFQHSASVIERSYFYQSAIDIGFENFFIGAGAGSFYYELGVNYPHNLFLEIFVAGGLIGLLLFVLYLIFAYRVYKAVVVREPGVAVLGIMAILALIQMQFSFSLGMAKPLFFLGGISGALVSRVIPQKKNNGGKSPKLWILTRRMFVAPRPGSASALRTPMARFGSRGARVPSAD